MGKGGKAQTVGYKYYLGMHQILCHGPIDAITRITVDDREAWAGYNEGGPAVVNRPSLFGGDGREGGVSGTIDIEMGHAAQGQNGYLVSKLGALIPAYRRVVGAVFRQCYLGNNPYLKPWRFRGQRIYVRQDGAEQWYVSRAPIGSLDGVHAINIALDLSGSMDTVTGNGLTRLANAKVAINGVLDFIGNYLTAESSVDIRVAGWSTTVTAMTRRNCSLSDIAALKAFVNGLAIGAGTDFNTAISGVSAFFTGSPTGAVRSFMFVTDGEPTPTDTAASAASTLFAIPGVVAYGFNIELADTTYTAMLDNTAADGVPVLDGSDPNGLASSIASALGGGLDLNPIHIIRECFTDPDWGMGYTDADIDADSFEGAADTIFLEGLGMSLLWDRQIELEKFVDEVKKHIDAAIYVSRTTGKFVVKLIRKDYNEATLLRLDETNIARIEEPRRASFGELVNSVTVNYWDSKTGKDASLTVTDTALVQLQGAVINTTIQYPGFTNPRCATIAAQRDLKALSSPGLSCVVYADSTAEDLNIGDCFKLSWSRWGLVDVVMRVTGIAYGNGRSKQVRINCTQDSFDTNTSVVISVPDSGWSDPSGPPGVPEHELAFEAPYFELVQVLGQASVDAALATKPEVGYAMAAASRAPSAISARLWADNGGGYENVGALDFCPSAELVSPITKTQTAIVVDNMEDISEVVVGTHVQVDEEIMRVDAIDALTGEMTVGRGVLDTVPAAHAAGAVLLFWDQYAGFDPTEYVAGETIDLKVLPFSGSGAVALADADALEVTMDTRAARPYAPGNLRLNGESYAVNPIYSGAVAVTWAHRDRLQQTGSVLIDHTTGDIGPEPGTTYRVRGYVNGVLDHEEDDIAGNSYVWTPTVASEDCRVEVYAKRDGIYSWQAPSHSFSNDVSGNLVTADGDAYITEGGDPLVTE